jgi:hypothetical protein
MIILVLAFASMQQAVTNKPVELEAETCVEAAYVIAGERMVSRACLPTAPHQVDELSNRKLKPAVRAAVARDQDPAR